MTVVDPNENNIDFLFSEIGEFGVFQLITYLLICIPNAISGTYVVSYIFTASTLDYRCSVPECDGNGSMVFDQPWLSQAIPLTNSSIENCLRFEVNRNVSVESGQCLDTYFDRTAVQKCDNFVFKTDERNIQSEFGLMCEESYKLALVGTINNAGRFIFMPLSGILSDKYGRLTVLVVGMVGSSIFGLIKSFSVNYWMFIICEFFEASAGVCTFAAVYILGVEWVSTKKRVIGTTIVTLSYPIGEVFLGLAAMYIHNFRYLLRVLYTPGLLMVTYFWLVPESIRWLLVTGQTKRAETVLKRAARINGRQISEKTIHMIQSQYGHSAIELSATDETIDKQATITHSFKQVLRSKTLSIRLINSCFCWMVCAYSYYGLSLSSTKIQGDQNKYFSFMTVAAAEIPGLIIALLLLNRFGRRALLCAMLVISGLSSVVSPLIPAEQTMIILVLFIIGKCAITCAFSVLYIFTAELWPTNLRNTMMNLCSMIGRAGAMFAPLTPLLAYYFTWLPFALFGSSAILAGFLILFTPETLNKKLPDTIEEARKL